MSVGHRTCLSGLIGVGFSLALATVAFAQPSGPPASPVPGEWRLTAGAGWLSWRDIVRTGPPVDASPIVWRGSGTAFLVQHDSPSTTRLHRWTVKGALAGHFSYDSTVGSVAVPSADHFRALDLRYEYRRYPFRDVRARGLDVGVGIETRGGAWSRSHTVPVAIETRTTAQTAAVGIVLAGRWHRSPGWHLDVAWTNAIVFAHATDRQNTDGFLVKGHWGGGWVTDMVITAGIALSRRTGIGVAYVGAGDGTLTSRGCMTTAGRQVTLGVTYAR